jgi:hypothetical protein
MQILFTLPVWYFGKAPMQVKPGMDFVAHQAGRLSPHLDQP